MVIYATLCFALLWYGLVCAYYSWQRWSELMSQLHFQDGKTCCPDYHHISWSDKKICREREREREREWGGTQAKETSPHGDMQKIKDRLTTNNSSSYYLSLTLSSPHAPPLSSQTSKTSISYSLLIHTTPPSSSQTSKTSISYSHLIHTTPPPFFYIVHTLLSLVN